MYILLPDLSHDHKFLICYGYYSLSFFDPRIGNKFINNLSYVVMWERIRETYMIFGIIFV